MIKLQEKNFIISDLHLWHSNVCRFCNRPYDVGSNDDLDNPELLRMNEDILKMYDELPESCNIWNLGDLCFTGRNRETFITGKRHEILKGHINRMKNNGSRKLYLVLGNHDDLNYKYGTYVQFYESLGFDFVYNSPIIIEDKFILSHRPIYIEKGCHFHNFHGHTHDKVVDKDYFKHPEKETEIKWPDREIDISHYHNVCYDNLHLFLRLDKIINLI